MLTFIAIPILVLMLVSGAYYMWRTGGELFGGGLRFKMFVAWRYLLVNPARVTRRTNLLLGAGVLALVVLRFGFGAGVPLGVEGDLLDQALRVVATLTFIVTVVGLVRHSKPALYTFIVTVALGVACTLVAELWIRGHAPVFPGESLELPIGILVVYYAGRILFAIAGLAWFLGCLRAYFTFFTTVPIFGVFIGTSALVMVLAVMSGFESDLRDKILGSNAHIQITQEEGDFAAWREAKAKIDAIPGVLASSPYAVSEVVIAANNNGMNVIIKGIDPETVGNVTDLVADLEDPDAMRRLEPLVDGRHDRVVPQTPQQGGVIDPPPADMPSGGEPIDFSAQDEAEDEDQPADGDDGEPEDASGDDDAGAERGGADPEPFGGDALDMLGDPPEPAAAAVIDPPPDDMLTTDEAPVDYSGPDGSGDGPIQVVDIPLEPTLSRRTQALPGILVGRELVKQTHLYTGEEVRIVSPLSDPSNPDATGTPIPFNRDFRVAGVFYTGMYEYDLKYVYVTLDALQDFLDLGDTIDGIEVRISDPDETGYYAAQIRDALGDGYRIVDWRELNQSLFAALKLEKIAMFFVLGIVILVASFSIVGNLIMVVVEKGREIALLKTLGASDPGVMQLFAIQGLMIGVIGTVLGVAAGLAGCWAGTRFGLPLNPDVYYIDRLPIHVDPVSVLAAAAAGVVISILATFYPAMLASRVRPATGLRH